MDVCIHRHRLHADGDLLGRIPEMLRSALWPRPPGHPGSGKSCFAQSPPYRVCETEPDRHRGPSQPHNASTSAAGRPCQRTIEGKCITLDPYVNWLFVFRFNTFFLQLI